MAKIFPIDYEEKNTIAPGDFVLFSDAEDWDKIKKAQYSNLKGEKGDTGTAATIAVGSTTTWAAGTSASVTNVRTSGAAVFNFTIPKGDKWDTGQTWPAIVSAAFNGDDIDFTEDDWNVVTLTNAKVDLKGDKGDTGTPWSAATITVGTTTTLDAWDSATVTNSGTSSAAVFNFGIPKWDTGDTGATWNWIASITSSKAWKTTTVTITETNGDSNSFTVEDWADGQGSGDVIWPNSSTDGDLALFDGATWKIIKDWGALTTKVFTLSSTSDTTNAQAAYDWYRAGKEAIILYSWNYYYFKSTATNSVYFAVNGYSILDNTDVTSLVQKTLTLALSGTTVTSISSRNMSLTSYNVLRTGKDYTTPYTPQYNWSPATKKYVDDSVSTLMGLGKFLSLWDATTGQPISFPLDTPYTYTTWDYFLVETVSSATPPVNYKPNGSSYSGTASSTTESEELAVWDIYIYDGTNWLLQLNHGKSVSFSEIAGDPTDNTALGNALGDKQDTLTAGTWINIDGNNEITNTWVTSVNGSTWAVTVEEAKVFEISDLTSAASLATATQAYTYAYTTGNYAVIRYAKGDYAYARGSTTAAYFTRIYWNWAVSSWNWLLTYTLKLTVSSWSVTAISQVFNSIDLSSTAPISWSNSTITLVI